MSVGAFVAQDAPRNDDAWRATPLYDLELVALLIDGRCPRRRVTVSSWRLGLDKTPTARHTRWASGKASAENTTRVSGLARPICRAAGCGPTAVCSSSSMERKSGSTGRAVTQTFGPAALVQRCQVHKRGATCSSICPNVQRPWVKATLTPRLSRTPTSRRRRRLSAPTWPEAGGRRLAECSRQHTGRARRDAHRGRRCSFRSGSSRSLATTNAVESLLSQHTPREAERETLARGYR